jgi:hypothetical protein
MLLMRNLTKTVAIAPLLIALASCGDPCSSELLATSQAPNGHAQASFSRANCGATTGYRYEVRVSGSGNASTTGDTVLRFDDNHAENWPNDDREVVSMSWTDKGHLLITANVPIRIFAEEASADGISVSFRLPAGTVRL